jgi:hypothetical protein
MKERKEDIGEKKKRKIYVILTITPITTDRYHFQSMYSD